MAGVCERKARPAVGGVRWRWRRGAALLGDKRRPDSTGARSPLRGEKKHHWRRDKSEGGGVWSLPKPKPAQPAFLLLIAVTVVRL